MAKKRPVEPALWEMVESLRARTLEGLEAALTLARRRGGCRAAIAVKALEAAATALGAALPVAVKHLKPDPFDIL